jgi:hypothetical protein
MDENQFNIDNIDDEASEEIVAGKKDEVATPSKKS